MARASLGSLIVSLGLDAAEYFAGLTKAEYDAKKFAAAIDKGIATAARGAGVALGAMATAGVAAFALIQQAAHNAASFKDLEEKTGASAEGLASMAVAAGTAEASMTDVASASVKLTKNLIGVDDESKDAGAALLALGIPIKEFKALDPAAQMEAVAKALAGFEDGASKTAVALALFGKAGADLLPFLKELGGETGRQVILTQQQIETADRYADAQARAKAQLQLYVQALAIEALPAITDVTTAAKLFIEQLVGIDTASRNLSGSKDQIRSFADGAADYLADVVDVGDAVVRIFQAVGKSVAFAVAATTALVTGHLDQARAIADAYGADIDRILNKPQFSALLQQTRAARQASDARRAIEDRGFRPPGRQLTFTGAADKAGRGAAERQSDADRYLASIEKQQEQLLHLTHTEQFLRDLQMGRLKDVTHAQIDQILGATQALDAAEAQAKAEKELKEFVEERARAEQQTTELYARETATIQAANDAMAEEVMLMGADEKAHIAFAQAQLATLINHKENEMAMRVEAGATADQTHELERQIELLKDRQGILAQKGMKQQLLDDAAAAKKYNDIFVSSFTDGLASIVDGTKSVSQAFKDMEKSIVQAITRIAAQKIAESIFGVGTSGGGGIGSFFASLFGGGGTGFSGGGFGEHFAGGGFSRGGYAMVGERGPEMVRLPRGAQVIPNDVLAGKRAMRQTVNINVVGGVTSKTADQIAVQVGRATQRAIARNA